MSTPKRKSSKENTYNDYKSAPQEDGKFHKKKKLQFDEENIASSSKWKPWGGWTSDDQEDFPRGKGASMGWESYSTTNDNGYNYRTSGIYGSNCRSPKSFSAYKDVGCSHGKGCRPYICDTSYRHSNCLDRYRKLKTDSDPSPASLEIPEQPNSGNTSAQAGGDLAETPPPRGGESSSEFSMAAKERMKLKCPLCRGHVHGWKVLEDARKHLNLKTRNSTDRAKRKAASLLELMQRRENDAQSS